MGGNRSFGDMDDAEKDSISHRRIALDRFAEYMRECSHGHKEMGSIKKRPEVT
jgi:hypothetical protein